jgi:hypothetical protein
MPANKYRLPSTVMPLDHPTRVEHILSPEGRFWIDIDHPLHEDPTPITFRVAITKEHIFQLLAQLEATRQQFGLPLPAVFHQRQTRQ